MQTSARPSSQLLRALAERALVHNSARFKSMLRDANSPRHAEGCSHRYSPKLGLQRPTLMHEASLIFNADNIADATHVYVTDVKTAATGANGQAANFAFGALTGTQNAANWQAVPEPTSGLLMLVGLAGLALRRRRA